MQSKYVGQQFFQGLDYKGNKPFYLNHQINHVTVLLLAGFEQLLGKSGVIETEEVSQRKIKDALFSELLNQ